jgi:hypothetical protein
MNTHNELTSSIDNVIAFKKFLDAIVSDIKEGEYNVLIIKKISENAEEFFSNFDEDMIRELKEKYNRPTPRTIMVSSDEEESDDEMSFLPETKPASFSFDDDDIDRKFKELEALIKKPTNGEPGSSTIPSPKKKDVMIEDFLNNGIDITKYHYLKTIKRDIDSYCDMCYSY